MWTSKQENRTANSTYPKGGVSCSKDSAVVAVSSVLRINICAKIPPIANLQTVGSNTMRKLEIIFTLIIFFTIFSCEKKNSNLEFEKEIINNLFVEMVDSIHKDPRIYLTFPPFPDIIYDQKGNKIGVDSTEYKIEIVKYNHKEELRKKDTTKLVIGVSEKIYKPSEYEYESIQSYFKTLKLQIDTTSNSIENKIDLENFKNNNKFRFRYLSEFPEGANILNNDGTFKFSGGIAFSKIIFDKRKQLGILCGNYLCAPRCGIGYLIIIEKINNKWKIKQIEQTWQS